MPEGDYEIYVAYSYSCAEEENLFYDYSGDYYYYIMRYNTIKWSYNITLTDNINCTFLLKDAEQEYADNNIKVDRLFIYEDRIQIGEVVPYGSYYIIKDNYERELGYVTGNASAGGTITSADTKNTFNYGFNGRISDTDYNIMGWIATADGRISNAGYETLGWLPYITGGSYGLRISDPSGKFVLSGWNIKIASIYVIFFTDFLDII